MRTAYRGVAQSESGAAGRLPFLDALEEVECEAEDLSFNAEFVRKTPQNHLFTSPLSRRHIAASKTYIIPCGSLTKELVRFQCRFHVFAPSSFFVVLLHHARVVGGGEKEMFPRCTTAL